MTDLRLQTLGEDGSPESGAPRPVDFQAEGVRDLLGDAGTAEARVEALDLENRGNQFFGRSLGPGAMPSLRGKQPLILTLDHCAVKPQ